MDKKEKNILLATCYGHFLSHFNMIVFPAVLIPLSLELKLSVENTLSLSFWMYLLFGVTALPWGFAADKFGPKKLLYIFHVGAGLSAFTVAFNISDPKILTVCLAGIGLFSGIYHPVGLGWIASSFKRTSIGMAYNGIFGNLGLAVAPLLAGTINYAFGLKSLYLMVGFVNLIGCFRYTRLRCFPRKIASRPWNSLW